MAEFGTYETLLVEQRDFTLHVTLNRPHAKNAINFQMLADLTALFQSLHDAPDLRAVVLTGAEGTFCAGGDVKEMRENHVPAADNAQNWDAMLRAVNHTPQVVIARVEGAALGGGMGLVCVSDVAIAANNALFGLPEVRLGLAPAFISPYVLQRVGLMRSRELMLTGRRFDGAKAYEYGLVHEATPLDELDHAVEMELDAVRQCAPGAIAATKELIFTVLHQPTEATVAYRADLLNQLRRGEEAQEGMTAFSEKRTAKWVHGG